jgi:hypothetical protein
MVIKTYGSISFDAKDKLWRIHQADPHVRIMLKNMFTGIEPTASPPYEFKNTLEWAANLKWFLDRYPMAISDADKQRLAKGTRMHRDLINQMHAISLPKYKPGALKLKKPFKARKYQLTANDIFTIKKRFLMSDDFGLGKTLVSILPMMDGKKLPAICVCPSHLAKQYKELGIEQFTNLTVHWIKKRKPYNLPPADVYIITYGCLSGWYDLLDKGFFKYVIFEECHELRTGVSDKCRAARVLSLNAQWCMGLSVTPIYNYGGEIFNVMDVIDPGCLGTRSEFEREWCRGYKKDKPLLADPDAFGDFMKENFLMVRRTRQDVGMELPQVNKIIQYVDADEQSVQDEIDLAEKLAIRVIEGNFFESGEAARQFDLKLRQITGIAKAKPVAAIVKMLVEAGESVLLAGWHREVYRIWMEELKDYFPVMYTGSESPVQKAQAVKKFMDTESRIMIMSLRSGAGVEGLQTVAQYAVIGELDWSPHVHEQYIARLRRDGLIGPVTAIFPVSEFGCDPAMIDLLGLKASQSHGMLNPHVDPEKTLQDVSKIKEVAAKFLAAQKHKHHHRNEVVDQQEV